MVDRLRIGVIGLSHDHIWDHIGDLTSCEDAHYVGAAESCGELRSKMEEQYGGATWSDWREMLETQELDAVYIYDSNRGGAEASAAASSQGLHVMIEKPMAADLAGAARSGVHRDGPDHGHAGPMALPARPGIKSLESAQSDQTEKNLSRSSPLINISCF